MSREIKFRAFDTEEKKMLNNVNPIFSETGELDFLILEHGFYGYDMCEMEVKSLYSSMLHENLAIPVEIMQYIGRKDKNGTEVYEGDVVKCSSGCPHEVVFKLEHGGNVLGGMPTFYLSGLREGYQWTGIEEIIGNVYDSPELINK